MSAFGMELRRNRSLIAWLSVALLGYGAVMGALYPIMLENDELIRAYMDAFPKEFLAAFGMTGLLSDPGVFFTTYVGSWLWPIMAAVGALIPATRVVAGDLDRGYLDVALATPVSRTRYLAIAIAVQATILATMAVAAVLGIWLVGTLVGGDFDPVGFALAGVLAFAFGCAIAGPSTLLSVVTLSRGRTSGIVAGVLVAMYLAFVAGQVATDWSWLGSLSAWSHFATTSVIDDRLLPAGDIALFASVAAAGWVGGLLAFARRDLAA